MAYHFKPVIGTGRASAGGQAISRILYPGSAASWTQPSGRQSFVWAPAFAGTLAAYPETWTGRPHGAPERAARFLIWPCSMWGLPSRPVTGPLVRSYRTISPLPGRAPDETGDSATRRVAPSAPWSVAPRAPWSAPTDPCRGSKCLSGEIGRPPGRYIFCGTFRPFRAPGLRGTLPCGVRTFLSRRPDQSPRNRKRLPAHPR